MTSTKRGLDRCITDLDTKRCHLLTFTPKDGVAEHPFQDTLSVDQFTASTCWACSWSTARLSSAEMRGSVRSDGAEGQHKELEVVSNLPFLQTLLTLTHTQQCTAALSGMLTSEVLFAAKENESIAALVDPTSTDPKAFGPRSSVSASRCDIPHGSP